MAQYAFLTDTHMKAVAASDLPKPLKAVIASCTAYPSLDAAQNAFEDWAGKSCVQLVHLFPQGELDRAAGAHAAMPKSALGVGRSAFRSPSVLVNDLKHPSNLVLLPDAEAVPFTAAAAMVSEVWRHVVEHLPEECIDNMTVTGFFGGECVELGAHADAHALAAMDTMRRIARQRRGPTAVLPIDETMAFKATPQVRIIARLDSTSADGNPAFANLPQVAEFQPLLNAVMGTGAGAIRVLGTLFCNAVWMASAEFALTALHAVRNTGSIAQYVLFIGAFKATPDACPPCFRPAWP